MDNYYLAVATYTYINADNPRSTEKLGLVNGIIPLGEKITLTDIKKINVILVYKIKNTYPKRHIQEYSITSLVPLGKQPKEFFVAESENPDSIHELLK